MADAYYSLPSPAAGPDARNSRGSLAISLLHRIPLTSTERLAAPDAYADVLEAPSTLPNKSTDRENAVSKQQQQQQAADTVLYLAYGSNLSAETFLGVRGIRPVSQINVSAPSLRLVFDLPGLPYKEPCFANVAPRKIPKPPVPVPTPPIPVPNPPTKVPPSYDPDLPIHHPPASEQQLGGDAHNNSGLLRRNAAAGDPVWWDRGGLIGVVYEVTRADYAHIVATEGGGASYTEVAVPCFPLPPAGRVGVPEKPYPGLPPVPPRPFLARTLFAPRLPTDLPDGGNRDRGDDDDGDDGGGGDKDDKPKLKLPAWARRLLLPARRPDPEYAQPSARYLQLIRDGAAEHDLPGEYQEYLNAMQPYEATTRPQMIGRFVCSTLLLPLFLFIMVIGKKLADENGRVPAWMAAMMTVFLNLVWWSYDAMGKKMFGDGERTVEDGEKLAPGRADSRGSSWLRARRPDRAGNKIVDEEKASLMLDMD